MSAHMHGRARWLETAACWLALATTAPAAYRVQHGILAATRLHNGNDDYTAASPSAMVAIPQSTRDFTVPNANRGDYNINLGRANANTLGVLLACVAENGRNEGAGVEFATAHIERSDDQFFIPVSHAPRGSETNATVAIAYFAFAEGWICGYARNSVGNGPMTTLVASPGLNLGTEFVDDAGTAGIYTLTIPGANSLANGVLLVTGALNEDNYALSKPEANGSWTIYCKDNGSNGTSYENDPVTFAYVPVTQPGVQCGRVWGNGTLDIGSSGVSVQLLAAGRYELTIAGGSPTNGTLFVSPEGGTANNCDNIVTYAPSGTKWTIETRDLPQSPPTLQSMPAGERVFSFAYFPYTARVPRARSGDRVYHGRIAVVQNDAGNNESSVTETRVSGEGEFTVVGGNRGDIDVQFGPYQEPQNGVALACVRELSRDNTAGGDTIGRFHATAAVQSDVDRFFIPVFSSQAGNEVNINVATAYFPFWEDWTCGYAYNSTGQNGGPLDRLYASANLALGSQFVDLGGGTATLNIPGVNALTDGVLLVCGGKNEDNYALSAPQADGAFKLFSHDNGANGASYEQDPIAFVYIPGNQTNAIVGRIRGDGSAEIGDTTRFTVVKTGTGVWQMTIHGYTPAMGTLIVSPEGGDNYNVDNIVSYGELADRWIVESRDLGQEPPVLQDMGSATERCFSFAFFPYPADPPPATLFSIR